MVMHFNCKEKKLDGTEFHFGNIDTPYDANNLYFTYDNKPIYPISGEFHFSRYPHEEWEKELLKMKESGVTILATYLFWNYHEVEKGVFDFSGDKNVHKLLSICKKINMPCLIRIGPWCHGEVIYGGFPKWIHYMLGKRSDAPKYLAEVEKYWTRLYKEVEEFLDGETVIGIQLENEYTGTIEHVRTLRNLATKIGYKTPYFTMTAWPTNTPDRSIMPTMGGYPEAPWTHHKKPLKPNNRFAITAGRTEDEIGGDLFEMDNSDAGLFDDFAYAGCEVGTGNQVTQHRRPNLGTKDVYGVPFAHFASGMNWLGYYIYHGSRNPNDKLYQENRLTLYPNNYQIIDYDFQSPISRFGYCRESCDYLRLMHLFINTFDKEIVTRQAYFPNHVFEDASDITAPKCSVRMDENLSGYFFITTYERGLAYRPFCNFSASIKMNDKEITLPPIHVHPNSMFFYPFNMEFEGKHFDYILAQPITKTYANNKTTLYFVECEGVTPALKTASEAVKPLPLDKVGYSFKNGKAQVELVVLSMKTALTLHNVNGKAAFTNATAYTSGNELFVQAKPTEFVQEANGKKEIVGVQDAIFSRVVLAKTDSQKLPYNYFLYSHGKRHHYKLTIDKELLEKYFDVELTFDFTGLNLQVFSGKQIINDYFNIDGKFVMCLREYKKYIDHNNEFIIKAVPQNRFGVGRVYNEINMPFNEVDLQLADVKPIVEKSFIID